MSIERGIQQIRDRVIFRQSPLKFIDTFLSGDTTPNVGNCSIFHCSGGVVTITQFDNGAEAQTVKILGDGNTTIAHGTYISTNTAANKLLAAGKVYTFTLIDGHWYEDA